MRFSATLLSLMAVVMALPVANDERDLVVTQEQTVTTTWCPETAEGVTASPVEKVVTATVVTTIQSTDVVTAPCSKCEEEEKAKETLQGVPSSTPAPAPAAPPAATTPAPAPAPVPEKPAGEPEKPAAPAPAPPAPVVTSAPVEAEAAPSTVWNVVTQYTTICPENYVPPPCDEQAAALSSVASAASKAAGGAAVAPLASVPDVPASVSIPDSLTAALASAINAASTYSVASGDDDVTYLDVTVTPTSTVNKTVTPTVTVGGSSSPSTTSGASSTSSAPFQTGPGKTEATPAVSTDAASQKIVGNAPPTPGPTVSTASDFSASIKSAASAAVDSALKDLAFNA